MLLEASRVPGFPKLGCIPFAVGLKQESGHTVWYPSKTYPSSKRLQSVGFTWIQDSRLDWTKNLESALRTLDLEPRGLDSTSYLCSLESSVLNPNLFVWSVCNRLQALLGKIFLK
jgi:hypothetical protein